MNPQLELRFEPDTDGIGELFASARCERFAGAGSAWFREAEILAFATQLRACFPMAQGTELRLEGGHWESSISGTVLKEVRLGIRIYPVGSTGAIGIHLRLGEPAYEQQRPESRRQASFELMASYEDLARWGAQIQHMLQSPASSASLFQDQP